MRQVVLDTETTGLSFAEGHRLTEIGCVEIIDRKITGNNYQTYLNPEREIDEGAAQVTGLTLDFLKDKPLFTEVVDGFLDFIKGAELIIHNAPFDLGFLNGELTKAKHKHGDLDKVNPILDTLMLARSMHPGAKNNLDALCTRYKVDNTNRDYHGALLDSEILARVYLAMTAGQTNLNLSANKAATDEAHITSQTIAVNKIDRTDDFELKIIQANSRELVEHEKMLELIKSKRQ